MTDSPCLCGLAKTDTPALTEKGGPVAWPGEGAEAELDVGKPR